MPIEIVKDLNREIESLTSKGYGYADARKIVADNDARYEKYVKASFTDKSFWESLSDIGGGIGYDRTIADDYRLLATYVNDDIVHTCIALNANAVASLPYGVYSEDANAKQSVTKALCKARKKSMGSRFRRKDIDSIVEHLQHPLFDIIENDTEDLNNVDMVRLTVTYLQICGRSYWQLLQDSPTSQLEGIRILKPWLVFPFRDIDGNVVSYFYTNIYYGMGGKQTYERIELSREEIVDFRWPSPSDPYAGGDSPLRAAYMKIAVNDKFVEWMNRTLNNRARIDGIVTVDDADPAVRTRVELDFNNKFGASGNGGVLTVDGKKVHFTPISYSPTDLAQLEINDEVRTAVCNVLGIPPALVSDDPKYSNLENSKEHWQRGTILPLVKLIEGRINKYILPRVDKSGKTFFAFDNPIPEDAAFALEQEKVSDALFIAVLVANPDVIDPNEMRSRLGLEEWGAERLAELDDNTPEEPTEQGTDDNEPVDDEADLDADEAVVGGKQKKFAALLKINKEVAKGNIPRAIAINLAERLGYEDAKQLVTHPIEKIAACKCNNCITSKSAVTLETTEGKIKDAAASYFRHLKAQANGIIGKAYRGGITKSDTGIVPDVFVDMQQWARNLKKTPDDLAYRVKPLIEVGIREAANGKQTTLERAGASPDAFSVLPAKVGEYANKRSLRLAQSTLDTVGDHVVNAVEEIKQAILDGIVQGDSIGKLKDRIGEFFDDAAEWKADEIARTETSAATHIGQVAAAKASGIVRGFQYLISADACPVCQEYADQQIDLADYDDSGVVDADGAVPLHPNCTCSLEELLRDEGEQEETDET